MNLRVKNIIAAGAFVDAKCVVIDEMLRDSALYFQIVKRNRDKRDADITSLG